MRYLEADSITLDVIEDLNPQRRQDFINTITSKARVYTKDKIDVLEPLIALQHIPLISEDNFEELKLEDFGKIWEEMTIILTAINNPINKR